MRHRPLFLADAPTTAGLVFRHPRGEEDADALVAVRVGSAPHDAIDALVYLGGRTRTAEQMRRTGRRPPQKVSMTSGLLLRIERGCRRL